MNFEELIRGARSFRRFHEGDRIPLDVLVKVVDLARLAPSAGNRQALRFSVVSPAADCARLFQYLKWAGALKDWGGPAVGERPTGYILILGPSAAGGPAIDIGIIAQTMQLGATALGYGACQLGAFKREDVDREMGVPEPWATHLVLALGRPAETVVLEELPADGNTNYWRTPDGVHHVPKRALRDLLVVLPGKASE